MVAQDPFQIRHVYTKDSMSSLAYEHLQGGDWKAGLQPKLFSFTNTEPRIDDVTSTLICRFH
jgi:hypothetical protein